MDQNPNFFPNKEVLKAPIRIVCFNIKKHFKLWYCDALDKIYLKGPPPGNQQFPKRVNTNQQRKIDVENWSMI